MPRKALDPVATAAQQAIDALKDIRADLEIIKAGRGNTERHWTVRKTLWEVERLVDSIDPRHQHEAEQKANAPKPVKLIGNQPLFAIGQEE